MVRKLFNSLCMSFTQHRSKKFRSGDLSFNKFGEISFSQTKQARNQAFAALLKSDKIAVKDEFGIQMTSYCRLLTDGGRHDTVDIDLKIITKIIASISFYKTCVVRP